MDSIRELLLAQGGCEIDVHTMTDEQLKEWMRLGGKTGLHASNEYARRYADTLESENRVPSLTKAGSPESAMIAWFLPPEVAQQIAWADSEPPEDMHITLAYFSGGMDEKKVKGLHELVARFLRTHSPQPLTGKLGGVGRFNPSKHSDGKEVWYASVDVPGLSMLRHELIEELRRAGLKVADDHDFVPHVTLKYGPTHAYPESVESVPDTPITIDNLTIAYGGSAGGKLPPLDFSSNSLQNKSTPPPVNTDDDARSYASLFNGMWRKGMKNAKYALALKAKREDGTVEYLDIEED